MNKQNNIIIFLSVILLFSFIRMGSISSEINDLRYELENIKYKIEDIYYKTSEEEDVNTLVNDSNFKIKEIDTSKFVTNIDVEIELNRLSQNSQPVFAYREIGSNKWSEMDLVNKGSLVYSCNIELDQEKYYEYKIFTEGEEQESSEVQDISESDYTGTLHNWSVESMSRGGYYITVFDPYSKRGVKHDEFLVEDFYVEVKNDNETDKYEFKKNKVSDSYELDLKKKYLKEDKYKIDLVVKYRNGLEKRYNIDEK